MRELPPVYEMVFRTERAAEGPHAELLAWCDAADEVAAAYEAWGCAPRRWRALAHAAYVAALDREQAASIALARAA